MPVGDTTLHILVWQSWDLNVNHLPDRRLLDSSRMCACFPMYTCKLHFNRSKQRWKT